MRIVHILRAPVGGLFRHVRDLARAQRERGHDVGVLCDASANDSLTAARLADLAKDLSLGLVRIAMPRAPSPADALAMRAISKHLKQFAPDIVHGHGAKGGAYARLAVLPPFADRDSTDRAKAFYTPHGGSLHYAPTSLQGRVFMRLERALARVTSGMVFESAFARSVYERHVGKPACPVCVIPNGLQQDEFRDHVPEPDARDVVFVGELRKLKGVDVLLHALARRNAAIPTTALIVGEGPDAEAFQTLATDLGLSERVSFPGAMPAANAFGKGRCLVVPSRAESFPYIVLEGAAAQIPLVATNVGGIPEIVSESDTRLLPADNIEALAEAIDNTLCDLPAAQLRAKRLQQSVQARFTVNAMCDAVLHFYAASATEFYPTESEPYEHDAVRSQAAAPAPKTG